VGETVRIVLLMWLATLLFVPAPQVAAQNSIQHGVTILFDESARPLMYSGKDHEALGLYPRLVAEAFRRMQEPARLEAMPRLRALVAVDAGTAGIGGIYKTEDRRQHYDYSDPIYHVRVLLYSRADHPVTFRHIPDLLGLNIGVIRGWSYCPGFDAARADGRLVADSAESDAQNLAKLAAGRIDAILMVEPQDGSTPAPGGTALVAADLPIAENDVFIAFDHKAGQSRLLDAFNASLASMRADGSYDALVATVKQTPMP
jgi:polar amino acid transport system substrate-binding protein